MEFRAFALRKANAFECIRHWEEELCESGVFHKNTTQ